MEPTRPAGHCSPAQHALSRRLFLQGAIAGTAAFGGFGRLFAADHAAQAARAGKRVILLFMSGGPSQFETWDPKPGKDTGGPHLSIPTAVPGLRIDEFMPRFAERADRLAVIRSMTTEIGDHAEGAFLAQTGYKPSSIVAPPPHWLSVCAHEIPSANADLPSYVTLGTENGPLAVPGSGFLGAAYQALYCPGGGEGPQDLPKASPEQLQAQDARERLRGQIGGRFLEGRLTSAVDSHEASFRELNKLLAAGDLFDLERESPADRERYGATRFGRDCLLARRLVERGVPFVRVQHQNGLAWDKHRRAFDSQRHITTEFDIAVGALVDDLQARGLWEDTLLVMMGEFGRTPEIQGQGTPGRNHYTKSWSLALGGCGIQGGAVIGATNDDGTEIIDRPVTIHDLFCTFYRALGLNPHEELMFQDRPIPLVEDKLGKPLEELL